MRKTLLIIGLCTSILLTGCDNDGVSQEQYESVVAEKDALLAQLETQAENISFDDNISPEISELANNNGIQVVDEYYYMRGEDKVRYFIVIKNISGSDLDIDANVVAKDSEEKPLGVENERLNGLSDGQEMVMGFYFDDAGSAVEFDYNFDVQKSEYTKSFYDNLEFETSINKDKLIIMITNNGNEPIEYVMPYALFFKGGKLFSHEYSGYVKIDAGRTVPVELECYDGEFDDYKLYVSAWGKNNFSSTSSSNAASEKTITNDSQSTPEIKAADNSSNEDKNSVESSRNSSATI